MRWLMALRALRVVVGVGWIALSVGCGRDAAEHRGAPPAERAAEARPSASLGASSALLAPGTLQLWVADGGLVLFANQAPRLRILKELERALGFELEIADETGLEERLTLDQVDAKAEVVLALTLVGIPHALHYESGPQQGARHQLSRVVVGAGPHGNFSVRALTASTRARQKLPEERRVVLTRPERTPEEAAEEQRQLLQQLEREDPDERADAATWVEPEGEGFDKLAEALIHDPSPLVRAAAADTISEANTFGAVNLLLLALQDPDPEVVIAALDALEFVGDETIIPELAPLLEHANDQVRERTVEAIEYLE